MADSQQRFSATTLTLVLGLSASVATGQSVPTPLSASPSMSLQPLYDFRDGDVKFHLQDLMTLLRDRNHEGWVLAAYPDPATGYPLIGAGFSLSVAARDHPQYDPLNPNLFLEPSSAELWQAAGLDPERLQHILGEFHDNMESWDSKIYRRKIRTHTLKPQLTEAQANHLLRISAIQAVLNARAYCRNFDRLSGPAQMALSQLAFQLGVNLEQFVEFLSELNGDTTHRDLSRPDEGNVGPHDAEHWRNVQTTLIESQWARRYTIRAIAVIAMFDPDYARNPRAAEARVMAVLPPPPSTHRRRPSAHHAAR